MKAKIFYMTLALVLVLSFSLMTAVPAAAVGTPLSGYGVATSGLLNYSDGGWGGWSVPAGKVVLGGGFYATAPVAVSAPGTPSSVWPHHTYGPAEYGWVVQDALDGVDNTIRVYAIYADAPAGYGVATSSPLNYSDGGWGGWSVPAGKVVLGGGFYATAPVAASAPGAPGWVVQDALDGVDNTIRVYAIYADAPAGYGVATSSPLNYGDGGWGGWSVPAGKVALGGGFNLTGGPAAVSAPGTPSSVWPHHTYGPAEYGWVVRDAPDGYTSYGSKVYAIYADEPADGGGDGCFIATAAYGTSTAEEIDNLRAFRDEVMLESTLGSQIVEWYYQTSPPVADFISEHEPLRTLVRGLVIEPMVSLAKLTQGIWGD